MVTASFTSWILMITRHIQKNTGALLAMAWLLSLTSCRDFQDCRTPYKSFVTIAFQPTNKEDTLTISAITHTTTDETRKHTSADKPPLKLNADTNTVRFIIGSSSSTFPGTLTITYQSSSSTFPDTLTMHYQREAVLISHQCGCAYKYVLKEVTSTGAIKCKVINKELSMLNESHIDVQIYF